jgi:hypothetical protein
VRFLLESVSPLTFEEPWHLINHQVVDKIGIVLLEERDEIANKVHVHVTPACVLHVKNYGDLVTLRYPILEEFKVRFP